MRENKFKFQRGKPIRSTQGPNEKTRLIRKILAMLSDTREDYLPPMAIGRTQIFERALYYLQKVFLSKSVDQIRSLDKWMLQQMMLESVKRNTEFAVQQLRENPGGEVQKRRLG